MPALTRAAALFAAAWWTAASLACVPASAQRGAPIQRYRVVNTYPHDPEAYTQGLIFRDGFLYESTGLVGRSSVRQVRLDSGEVLKQRAVSPPHFAEGLTDWRNELIQLTWQSHTGFVYDLSSLSQKKTFAFPGEGWGLAHDERELILSDGSDTLRFLDPDTFREVRRLTVRDGATAVDQLNELEYVRGEVYANVWQTNRIARISPSSGRVNAWIDLSGLLSPVFNPGPEAVLNGIAYDAAANRLFVTGKLWPKLFEIAILP